jgi:hypothetical protein
MKKFALKLKGRKIGGRSPRCTGLNEALEAVARFADAGRVDQAYRLEQKNGSDDPGSKSF